MNVIEDRRVVVVSEKPQYPTRAPFSPSESYPELPDVEVGTQDNPAFRAVRHLMIELGWDLDRLGTPDWNPLASLIRPGETVALKPNLVSHRNHGVLAYGTTDTDSLVTHGSVVRAVLEYVVKALRGAGTIFVGDCPLQGTDWRRLMQLTQLDAVINHVQKRHPSLQIELRDFRLMRANVEGHKVLERIPNGRTLDQYEEVDMGQKSLLLPLMQGSYEFGVSQYSRHRMKEAHTRQVNKYLIPKELLWADVFINLPKMKSHMKSGVTFALKSLVGINGLKDYLPHFRFGSPKDGGDEYPDGDILWDLLWYLTHLDWEFDAGRRKRMLGLTVDALNFFSPFISNRHRNAMRLGGGSWHGNDTLWRTVLDINRAFLYYDPEKRALDPDQKPRRRYLAILDGLVAGHRESPLSPTPLPSGVMAASFNPLALDTVATALMGLDVKKIPLIWQGFHLSTMPLATYDLDNIEVRGSFPIVSIREIYQKRLFMRSMPSEGFEGQVEYYSD